MREKSCNFITSKRLVLFEFVIFNASQNYEIKDIAQFVDYVAQ